MSLVPKHIKDLKPYVIGEIIKGSSKVLLNGKISW